MVLEMRNMIVLSMVALASCGPTYTGGSGAGFDDGYNPYRAAREAELAGTARDPVLVEPGGQQVITGSELAAAGIGGAGAAGSTFQGGTAMPAGGGQIMPAQPGGNTGISDEQDFGAVSSRESIQSDAQRLAAQREAYQVIQPQPIPDRPRDTGPNIVAFALSTTNQPGEQIYSRSGTNSQSRFQRNCAKYSGSDQAQQAFLENGGPQRDRLGLDPDGDGFACYWDPRPFRSARAG
jgi:hypothetical protein